MKNYKFVFFTVVTLVIVLCASYAGAAGFQLYEENASGIGNAFAGSAVVADNASTIFFNPAGMTKLPGRDISLGASLVKPTMNFTSNNTGRTVPSPTAAYGPDTGTNGGDAGGWNFIPNAYMSWALTKDLYAGVGFSVPFGLATEYSNNFIGRYEAIKFSIATYNINPSVAYRINDVVSIGAGVSWQKMTAEYSRQATAASQIKINLDDRGAVGWNLGALFQLTPSTRAGLSYRSSVKHFLDGHFSGYLETTAHAEVELPQMAILSISQGLGRSWELLADVSWTGWSSVDKLKIIKSATGTVVQTLDLNLRDTFRAALGLNYKVNEAWKLRCGVAYDQSPVPDAEHRSVSLPDSDRVGVSVGVQWKPTKSSALDLGLEYLKMKETDINNSSNGTVKGDYSNSAIVTGLQVSLSF